MATGSELNFTDSPTVKWTKGAQTGTDPVYNLPIFPLTAEAQIGGVAVKTASYTAVASDLGLLLSFNSASAVTLTLPAAPPSMKWKIAVQNVGAGALTVSPNGLNLDGAASSLTLAQNAGVLIYTDGTNYFTERGAASVQSLTTVGSSGAATLSDGVLNIPMYSGGSGGGGQTLHPGVPDSATIPDISTWTVVNSGLFVSQNGGAGFPALMKVTNNASLNWRALKTTLPTPPYSVIVRLNGCRAFVNTSGIGVYWFDASNKMAGIELLYGNGTSGNPIVRAHKGNSSTADTSDTPTAPGFVDGNGYLALAQSATNQIYYYSPDGVNWIQLLSETTGTFMTPTGWGIGGIAASTGVDIYVSMTYFRQTTNSTCT